MSGTSDMSIRFPVIMPIGSFTAIRANPPVLAALHRLSRESAVGAMIADATGHLISAANYVPIHRLPSVDHGLLSAAVATTNREAPSIVTAPSTVIAHDGTDNTVDEDKNDENLDEDDDEYEYEEDDEDGELVDVEEADVPEESQAPEEIQVDVHYLPNPLDPPLKMTIWNTASFATFAQRVGDHIGLDSRNLSFNVMGGGKFFSVASDGPRSLRLLSIKNEAMITANPVYVADHDNILSLAVDGEVGYTYP